MFTYMAYIYSVHVYMLASLCSDHTYEHTIYDDPIYILLELYKPANIAYSSAIVLFGERGQDAN